MRSRGTARTSFLGAEASPKSLKKSYISSYDWTSLGSNPRQHLGSSLW